MKYKLSNMAFDNTDSISEMAVDEVDTFISFKLIQYQTYIKKGMSEICKYPTRVNYDYVATSNINREYPLSCAVNNSYFMYKETICNISKRHSPFHTISSSLNNDL